MFGAVESNAMYVERLKRNIIANENWEIEKKIHTENRTKEHKIRASNINQTETNCLQF